jgi:hypothetical protein
MSGPVFAIGQPVFTRHSYDIPFNIVQRRLHNGIWYYELQRRGGKKEWSLEEWLAPMVIYSPLVKRECIKLWKAA